MPLSNEEFLRYSSHLLLNDFGIKGQQKLFNAHVLITGLGGLGSPVALYLAAAGVGHLSLCDPDVVEITNLQRQILYTTSECNKLKVDSAKDQLKRLNPNITISCYPQKFSAEDLGIDVDVVVDCTDNLAARQVLNTFCFTAKIPLISASAMGWEGQLVSFNFSDYRRLCYNCIVDFTSKDCVTNCSNAGVIGPVLGVIGSMQAITVLHMLLGQFKRHGQLQRYDALSGSWLSLTVDPRKDCAVCGTK